MSNFATLDVEDEMALRNPVDLASLLRLRAALQAEDTAFVFLARGERETARLTFASLDRRARAIAARLQKSRATAPGARVMLLYPAGLDYIEAFFGCLYAGVIAAPAYPPAGHHRQRLHAIMDDAEPAAILTIAELRDRFGADPGCRFDANALPWLATDAVDSAEADDWTPYEATPDCIAFLQYTSGSTGDPRGVMVSHGNLVANQQVIRDSFHHTRRSNLVGWLPLHHDMGLIGNVLQPLFVGAAAHLMSPLAFLEKPARWLQAIAACGAHTSGGPNFAYDLCVRKVTREQKRDLDLSCWKVAFSGAEPVRAATLDRFAEAFAECGFRREAFLPCFGLAEGTLVVTAPVRGEAPAVRHVEREALERNRILPAEGRDAAALVGCGRPWRGHRLRIVDPDSRRPSRDGEVGEIWCAGPSVAAGYWRRPEETANVFSARIVGEDADEYLRTGDLGFIDDDELYVTGRLKDLIIVAGRNYYPQDFERVLDDSIDAVRPGCSGAFSVTIDERESVVIVAELERQAAQTLESAGANALLAQIRDSLAAECEIAPHEIVLVRAGAIPRTSSGKIRRAQCRREYLEGRWPVLARSGAAAPTERPSARASGAQAMLQQALTLLAPPQRMQLTTGFLISQAARLLGIAESELGPGSRLTSLGLDSLRALELKHALDAALCVETPLSPLLTDGTIVEIAEAATQAPPCATAAESAAAGAEGFPLSLAQRAIWTTHRLEPHSNAYNLHLAFDIRGPLDAKAFAHAFDLMVERHAALRMTCHEGASGPVQRPHASRQSGFAIIDARGWSDDALQAEMGDRAARGFDIEQGPLLKVALYRRSEASATALLCAHHIVADLWSLIVFLKEFEAAYRAARAGEPSQFPSPQADYYDFVSRQKRYLASDAASRDWDYWRDRLTAEPPMLALPYDRRRPASPGAAGGAVALRLDSDCATRLREFGREQGATLFVVLLAIYKTLLRRYTNQDEIVVGTAASGRGQGRFSSLVGNLVNPLALRTRLRGDAPFVDYLQDVRRCVAEALDHQDFPFSTLVERLRPDRCEGQWPIFQTFFVLQQAQETELAQFAELALGEGTAPFAFADLTINGVAIDRRVERFDLKLMAAISSDGGLVLSFQYRRELFFEETIARLAEDFRVLLERIVASPQTPIGALFRCLPGERLSILRGTQRSLSDAVFIPSSLSRVAGGSPRDAAIVGPDASLTYAELEDRTNRMAHYFRRRGVERGEPIGICATRSIDTIVAIVAALKAGVAYVSIEPDHPPARVAAMLRLASARFLCGSREWLAEAAVAGAQPIVLEDIAADLDAEPSWPPRVEIGAADLAYVIFTSGSTGEPKGVAVTHGGLANYTASIVDRLDEPGLRFALVSTLAADLGHTALFPCLALGGSLHLLDDDEATDPLLFAAYLERHRIDVLKITPSHFAALTDADARLSALPRKALIFGGEALPLALVKRVFSRAVRGYGALRLFNHYGPTETTVGALMTPLSLNDCTVEEWESAPIGRPLENKRAILLGPDLTPTPRGVGGEICLGGAGLAQGYVGRPDLTAERFLPDPYGPPGARLYRTGDLGILTDDGAMRFLGRIDSQLKIRGFRVEPEEAEARLKAHAGVAGAAVTPIEAGKGRVALAAFIVGKIGAAPSRQALHAFLRQTLPDYLAPSTYVFVDALPMTPNGKIDRKRLPAPDRTAHAGETYRAPRNDVEARLAAIYAALLGVETVGIDDGFFALGGDSILSIQAASRAIANGLRLSPQQIFRHQTIAELAAAIAAADEAPQRDVDASGNDAPLVMQPAGSEVFECVYPATTLQEGLLFHTLSRPNSGVYVMQHRYWIEGDVDVGTFRAAWQALVDAHPIFRTSFAWENVPKCLQLVHERVDLPFDFLDLRGDSAAAQEERLDDLLAKERRNGFDPAKAPLLHIRLVRFAERRYLLIRSHHHILFDAWCTSLILKGLQQNYRALAAGAAPAGPSRPNFADYIGWLGRQDLQAAEFFWRRNLEGFCEPTPLIGAAPAGAEESDEEEVEDLVVHLSATDTARLKEAAARLRVTPNTFAQTALALLLAYYANQEEVVFGVTVSGRPPELAGVETMLGLFINCLPLRVAIDMSERLPALLQRVLAQNYAIRDYEYASLTEVQKWSDVPRGVDLFQCLLTFENAPIDWSLLEDGGDWRFTESWHRTHTNYPLTFVVIPGPRLHVQLTYSRARYDRATAERLLAHYRLLLERMTADPQARVCDIAPPGEDEQRLLIEDWNQTDHDYAEPRDLLGRFERQVLLTPDAVAVACGDATTDYAELNARANDIAQALIEAGVGPDHIVALFDGRGTDFLAAMLGVFKAGAGYLPLDPAHPDARIRQVLSESKPGVMLCGAQFLERAQTVVAEPFRLDLRLLEIRPLASHGAGRRNPARRHASQNVAVVIFTSGSTGKPKGATIEHRGMFNNLITKVPALALTSKDVIAQTASQCFDISIWQFLTALTLGGRVQVIPDEISQDPRRLLDEISRRGVTILEAVPSMIQALLDASESRSGLEGLRWLLPCGEAFTPELCRRFMERYPEVRLLNAYGPAECSDDVSYHPVLEAPSGNELSVPIGRPVDNARLYILNRWFMPAPIGAPGEICVAGVQVGRGYLHRPDLTAAAFLPDPFGAPASRLYRTGDLGRWRADGVLEFLGRVDHQVKIRGFRIEPGEIEACLLLHPKVKQACVMARPVSKGVNRLVAYVVGGAFAPMELREHVLARLPHHMVPSAFILLEAMPLTPNGKIDRARLPADDADSAPLDAYVAPRNDTEEALCRIWTEILGATRVGVEDNFFELGGHSLSAIQVRSRIQAAFGVELPLRGIFDAPTISLLAPRIEAALIAELEALDEAEAAALRAQILGASAQPEQDFAAKASSD
ncbi:non-ribosomal peptide synthetase [Methylocystis heyeri]|nr:non-ribosomal peptide synthetase [Methylocystis heyeri]